MAASASSARPITEGSQGRSLEAGADAEAMLAPHVVFSPLSYGTQDHIPKSVTAHSDLGSLSIIT